MDTEELERRQFLKDEYLFLQAQYEDYDKRSLTIKGWVGTGAAASLAFSSISTEPHFTWFAPFSVITLSGVFWYLETYWKMFQYALGDRIRIIESYFREDEDILIKNPSPFQIYHYWFRSYAYDDPIFPYERDKGYRPRPFNSRLRKIALQRFVCLPYLPIIILAFLHWINLIFS